MGLQEDVQQIATRYSDVKDHILTEEATKTALIIPFIQALGYDTWNPREVVPEFNAVYPGTKLGDKVDFVIQKEGEPIIIVECKCHTQAPELKHESQLMRYFQALPGKQIAILTNGIEYLFYTDLDEKNRMDSRPFLHFDITSMNDVLWKELARFAKKSFSIDNIMPAAEELKYTGAIKKYLLDCLSDPQEAFVETMARQAYDGKLTEKMREKFKEIVKKAFNQFVSDRVSDRLSSALQEEKAAASAKDVVPDPLDGAEEDNGKIITTQDEIDGFNIIKAILYKTVDIRRVTMRDTVSYCAINMDDNNRRAICRLYFNNPNNKQLMLFSYGTHLKERKETKYPVKDSNDIYAHAEEVCKNTTRLCEIVQKAGKAGEDADSGSDE